MTDAPVLGNSFAALAADYRSSDDEAAPALPRVKQEETEGVIPPLGLDATTRVEIDLTMSEGSQSANDLTLTPPHGGGVRAREDTPSASLAFQERQAKVNAANNGRRRGETLSGTRGMVGSTKQVTSLPFRHPAAPANAPDLQPAAAGVEILVPDTQLPAAPAQSAGNAHENGPQTGAPRAAAPHKASRTSTAKGLTAAGTQQTVAATRAFMRSEPESSFARRTGAAANPRIKHAAPTSPSPAPSAARSQAGSGAATPAPQDGLPAPPFDGPGAADVDMYDDDTLPIPPPAQQRAASPPSPAAPVAFQPRGGNLVGEHRSPTDKELAAMTTLAPELALATVPFKAFGPMSPIDGALADAHLYGVGDRQIAYFDGKPGPKVVCHVYAMFNRLASTYTVDEILEMLENLSDRLFVAFPDDRLIWSHLYTPSNAPPGRRVRSNMFVARNMTPRQQVIWNAGRFLNAGDAQLISYLWHEVASDYKYSFAYFRTEDVDEAMLAAHEAMYESDAVKECITRQAQEDGIDPVDLMDTVCGRIKLGKIMVARPKSSAIKPQYDVYINVDDLFSDEELKRFTAAFRSLDIQHEEYGRAGIVRWSCRICQAISHPAGKCAAVELAGWREQPSASQPSATQQPPPPPPGPGAPNFNKPRRSGFQQPPAQPFNGGRRGGPHAGFA